MVGQMEEKYYVVGPEGQRFGPADIETLKSWVTQKRVKPGTKLIHAGTESEIEARTLQGLFDEVAPQTSPPMTSFRTENVNWGTVQGFLSPARFLGWLETGSLFNQLVGAVMRVFAVLMGLALVIGLVKIGDFFSGVEGLGVLAVLIGLLIIVWAYIWNIQILWIRGGHVLKSDVADTPLLKLASLLIRTFGEVAFVLVLGTVTAAAVVAILMPSAGAGLVSGLGPSIPLGPVSGLVGSYDGVLGGLVLLLAGAIYALAILFGAYLNAELLELAVKGLGHLRAIRLKIESS